MSKVGRILHSIMVFETCYNYAINFLGGPLPYKDKGDPEFYCLTMLTLFKSWREASDLKLER